MPVARTFSPAWAQYARQHGYSWRDQRRYAVHVHLASWLVLLGSQILEKASKSSMLHMAFLHAAWWCRVAVQAAACAAARLPFAYAGPRDAGRIAAGALRVTRRAALHVSVCESPMCVCCVCGACSVLQHEQHEAEDSAARAFMYIAYSRKHAADALLTPCVAVSSSSGSPAVRGPASEAASHDEPKRRKERQVTDDH